ncbi:cation-transporting P-type ATPase [Azospirillum rugosum]|uniref:Magnesium-transporting ATPase (P-type) n=1 Tax=Azospirillum rugosum TaxID=416170 RepID=A0ABS4SNQ2_9PROT|nr:cation-transporting P-type ATPase [Azospirillum rugosum]MBP2293869.1 magnesium-transporting ATPase (P-type) [Azospirillum rugosum]MDQ0526944.1 magnesium-transporting ATPase (P-type) [Azospirillum rugosum]
MDRHAPITPIPATPSPAAALPWHARPAAEALAALDSPEGGLSAAEARDRLERVGPNRLTPPPSRSALRRFAAQFNNLLIYVLIASGLVTLALGELIDAAVIAGVVLINALIGAVQEGKAEQALDAIRDMLSPQAIVLRGGRRITVPAEELVPGDRVALSSGDRVPADLRLIQAKGLRVQEAALTGESVPVAKTTDPVEPAAPLAERAGMAYSATLVAQGQAIGVVVATGDATELGRIGRLLAGVETLTTPLLARMAVFGRWLTVGILILTALTFLYGTLLRGEPWAEMVMAAVGLAVAAIPEGLPTVMTITLAIGVTRMARRNAIIRRLPAVETLGSVGVICSDKTGTLTRNELTVQTVATAAADYAVTGTGYEPEGTFRRDAAAVDPAGEPVLADLARAALLCNDAALHRDESGDWTVSGDPTDGALLALARKAGLDPAAEAAAHPRADVIPFESEHKFMATLHRTSGGSRLYVKGAPERVLALCDRVLGPAGPEPLDAAAWAERVDDLAAEGQRVLALAVRTDPPVTDGLTVEDLDGGLALLGLCGLIDPPREEAIAAVLRCQAAGIRVKMITGDHAGTAQAIGRRFGLSGPAVTGAELDGLDDAALGAVARDTDVFARTAPEHKLRLVQALQAAGQTIAMTGDGVNDAPALKRADIGIAMGRKGTEAAKEAAAMVLADDNFASIARAVEEGRTVYDNLRKTILFLLPTNGAQALVIMVAVLGGYALPITPVQILWVNMVTAVTLGLALAFEPPEPGVMDRPPRPPNEPLLPPVLIARMVMVMALLVACSFGFFSYRQGHGDPPEVASTMAVNALVLGEIAFLFNARAISASVLNRAGLFGSRPVWISVALMLALQLAFTYAPPLQRVFGTAAVGWTDWAWMAAAAVAVFLVVEAEKALTRRFRNV